MADYITEADSEGRALVRENVENQTIRYVPGLSTAYAEDPSRARERKAYLKDVLAPMIERGEIGDGIKSKWDDRKFRFDSASLTEGNLELRLGITHYKECADCRKLDDVSRRGLELRGERLFGDSSAFFTRGCGIGATVITGDGSVFAGKRKVAEEASGYSGELGAVNGWVDYKETLSEVDFRKDVVRELEEEYGIREDDISRLIFSGVFSAPTRSDTDFVYIVPLNITNGQFFERFKARKDEEHEKLVRIATYAEMQRLLQTGELPGHAEKFNLLYSLRASLEQIRSGEMAN